MSAICLHTFRYLPWSATKTNMTENSYWHIKTTLSNMKNMLVFWKTCHLWLRARVTKMSDFSWVLNYTIIQIGELSITIQQAQRKYWKNHIHWDISTSRGKWIIGITTLLRFYDRKSTFYIYIYMLIFFYS